MKVTSVKRKCVLDIFRARKRTTQPPIDLLLYSKRKLEDVSIATIPVELVWVVGFNYLFSFQIFVRNP